MHLVYVFTNIGSYHAARLRSIQVECAARNWEMTAIQITDDTLQHPWGDLSKEITFPLITLQHAAKRNSKDIKRYLSNSPELVAACLSKLNPDAVFLPGWSSLSSRAALGWCRKNGCPAILMSESKWDDAPRKWWKERLKSWLYVRKFDAALVSADAHRNYAASLGIPAHRIFLGYSAVDNDYFEFAADQARANPQLARSRHPLIPDKPYFLCITRFLPRKNIIGLLEAYSQYHASVTPEAAWPLVICGSGKEQSQIQNLITRYNLHAAVLLPGFIPYHALGDWYGLAGALVHPALQEQWGLVVNEACASGLPVLASRTAGACAVLVHESLNGFLFDPHSQSAITEALTKLHQLSEPQRLKMGSYSRNLVRICSPQNFAVGSLQAVLSIRKDAA